MSLRHVSSFSCILWYLILSDVHVRQTSTWFSRRGCFPLINETCDVLLRIACCISSGFNENTTQSDEGVVNKSNNDVHWGFYFLSLALSLPSLLSLFFSLSLLLLVILVRGNRNEIVQNHRRGMTEEGAKIRMATGEIR